MRRSLAVLGLCLLAGASTQVLAQGSQAEAQRAAAAAREAQAAIEAKSPKLAVTEELLPLRMANHTAMVRAISGRPARCLANRFTRLAQSVADAEIPDYPITYDLGKALHAAAKARGEFGFGAQWAGQGAPLSRPMPAAELVRVLAAEMQAA